MAALFSLHCLLLALHTPPHVRFITPKYHVQRAALLASEDAADAASTKSSSESSIANGAAPTDAAPNALDDLEKSGLPTDLGPLPPVGETLRSLDPASVGVVSLDLDRPLDVPLVDPTSTFVGLFRQCTPYIKMHQDSTMVIHVASEVLEKPALFDLVMEEVAVLALLGVRPVLLVSVRCQIEASLRRQGLEVISDADGDTGYRVTDEQAMVTVQEVVGFMRSRVEGALARGRARSGPGGSVGVDVVGGNFFYTAQPVGVRNGIDFGYTGEVRSIDVEKVNQHLSNGEIVLMTPLGYSASGTIFNVKTEEVATAAAASLAASKLIFLTPERLVGGVSRRADDLTHAEESINTAFVCSAPAQQPLSGGAADGSSEPQTHWGDNLGDPSAGDSSSSSSSDSGALPPVTIGEEHPVLQSMRLAEAKTLMAHYSMPSRQPRSNQEPQGEVCAAATPNVVTPKTPRELDLASIPEWPKVAGGGKVAPNAASGDAFTSGSVQSGEVVEEAAVGDDEDGDGALLAEGAAAEGCETSEDCATECTERMLRLCRHCVKALELGVLRAHILPPTSGALIQELYTTDGIGTLISRDVYDGIRLATAADIPGILTLIEPLEARGTARTHTHHTRTHHRTSHTQTASILSPTLSHIPTILSRTHTSQAS